MRARWAVALLIVLVVVLVVAVAVRSAPLATVCISHPAHITSCVPIKSVAARDRWLESEVARASRAVMFASFVDFESTARLQALGRVATDAGVDLGVYYESRPGDPRAAEIHARMAGLGRAVRLRRRAVTLGSFPFVHAASTHFKATVVDDQRVLMGSANALAACYYLADRPTCTCQAAQDRFLAPAFLEFDVALAFSCPVPQIAEYLTVISEQRPWTPRSVHMTFADGCEFHVFPAGVRSRDAFLARLVRLARRRVTFLSLSVWPTGEFRSALLDAVDRGIEVTLVGSACECSRSQRLYSRLNRCAAANARWMYREWSPVDGLVHAKFLLRDDDVVLPSFNYSMKSVSAATDDEVALVLTGPVAREAREALDRMLRERTARFTPTSDPVFDALLGLLNPLL